MCGRYAIFTEEENQELRNIVNDINEKLKGKATAMKTGEIFPTDTVPVITDISSDGKKQLICLSGDSPISNSPAVLL